jgi:hypothetical protein
MKSSTSTKEEYCRKIFEKIYGVAFPSVRPDFLHNPETSKNLELDGYNEKLRIAFEYNGKQHYEYPNEFHRTEQEFIQQVRRDIFKKEVCKKMGIRLISIPYYIDTNNLYDYIEYYLSDSDEKLDPPEYGSSTKGSISVKDSLL